MTISMPRALGYIMVRDRLFQMDLMRRKNAGRLAVLFGQPGVKRDINTRTYGFYRIARTVVAKLPYEHRRILETYAEGVNNYLDNTKALPFEFTLLNYRPEPWQSEDSILVELGMFDLLIAWAEQEERMLSVMEKYLPAAMVAFLTPDTDPFTESLSGSAESLRSALPIPVAAFEKALAKRPQASQQSANAVQLRDFMIQILFECKQID
ncbi:MAG: penicillin acylase family protein [Methylococcaceae bacterium]|nr:penicillin acylase family protein [Methylococcaceae bacterium]